MFDFKKPLIYGIGFLLVLAGTVTTLAQSTVDKIEEELRKSGHYQLVWISRTYPYVVEACHKFNKFSFTFNKKRRIKNKSNLGECRINQPALPMRAIMTKLEKQGYTGLNVKGVGLTGFQIKACLDEQRYILEVNHWGGILARHNNGKCKAVEDQESITVIR